MDSHSESISPQVVRVMQIIAAALIMGVLTFLCYALYHIHLRNNGQPPLNAALGPLDLVLWLFAAISIVMSFVMPRLMTRMQLQRLVAGTWTPAAPGEAGQFASVTSKLTAIRQTGLIIGLALLEGPAFFALTAYLLNAAPASLGIAIFCLLLMALQFPTLGRVQDWIDNQADVITEMLREKKLNSKF